MRLATLLPSPENHYALPAPPRPQTHVWQPPPSTARPAGVLVELAPGVRVVAERADEHPYRWLPDPPEWHRRAACAGMDQTIFYGTDVGDAFTLDRATLAAAERVCGPCPVRRDCLTDALDRGEHYGVHGGVSGRGKERLWARQRATGISTAALVEEALR